MSRITSKIEYLEDCETKNDAIESIRNDSRFSVEDLGDYVNVTAAHGRNGSIAQLHKSKDPLPKSALSSIKRWLFWLLTICLGIGYLFNRFPGLTVLIFGKPLG